MSEQGPIKSDQPSTDIQLVPSLLASITDSKLADLGIDIAEIALDSVLAEGLLRGIPVVSTVVALGKTGLMLRDRLFLKKILAFLDELDKIPEPERTKVRDNIGADPDYAKKVGDTLITLLDKYDEPDKARLLARLFSSYISGQIDRQEFLRHSNGLTIAYLADVQLLLAFYSGKAKTSDVPWEALYPSGFSDIRLNLHEPPEQGGALSLGYGRMVLFGPSDRAKRFAMAILGPVFVSPATRR